MASSTTTVEQLSLQPMAKPPAALDPAKDGRSAGGNDTQKSPLQETHCLDDRATQDYELSTGSATPTLNNLKVSKAKGVTVIITLAGISFLNVMGSGILIAALPQIAKDVGIPEELILWPAAVYSLAAGCLLLIFGAVADVIGPKLVWVVGSFLHVIFTIGIGLARTSIQIIVFRVFLGVAISMCLPTTVSLITNTFPKGHWRNTAFAMNGMGQPLGYAVGLVLGGIFTDTIGWRWAYFVMAIINFCFSMASLWSLPAVKHHSDKSRTRRLLEDIDWLGAIIISAALGLLMYVLAVTTSSYRNIRSPPNIALLVVSGLLLVAFPCWMHFQCSRSKPALIPNRLWRNASFTSICVSVFFCWACLHSIEYFITLYFQKVQELSALQSSIRFLPDVIMGTVANLVTVYLISRVKIQKLAVGSALITMIGPVLMATIKVNENYWFSPFWALLLSPVNPDVLFIVSNIVISDAFPAEIQSLAGGVFNEVAQFGNSVGLAVTAAIAASVTEHSDIKDHIGARMVGYRAAFWTIFAGATSVVFITFLGLKKGGTVGKKGE